MRKGKKPDTKKPDTKRHPGKDKDSGSEAEFERQTQEKAELVPPARRPPPAVGAETPPLPPREPPRPPPPPGPSPQRRPVVSERQPLALTDLVHAIRRAVGALLDVADAAADLLVRGLPFLLSAAVFGHVLGAQTPVGIFPTHT